MGAHWVPNGGLLGHDGGPMSPQWTSGKKRCSPLKNRKKPGKIGGGGEHGRGGDAKMAPIRHKTPPRRLHEGPKMPAKSLIALRFFPQHLVEGLLNFRRRVCRSFWLDLAFQDPPGKTDQCYRNFFGPPNEIKHSSDFLMIFHDFSKPKNRKMTKQ